MAAKSASNQVDPPDDRIPLADSRPGVEASAGIDAVPPEPALAHWTDPLSAPIQSARPGARIWILDPDKPSTTSLQRQLETCGWQCLLMQTSTDLEALLIDVTPDVLVMEDQVRPSSGCQVVQRLRAVGYRFPVVMLCSRASALDRIRSLEAGADDVLAKPCAERELMLRLERLLLNAAQSAVALEQNTDRYQIADLQFDPGSLSLSCGAHRMALTRGDAALLVHFCQSPGLILNREQLARGSGSLVDVSNSRSMDMRISKLRRVLTALSPGLGDQLQAVRGRGYRLVASVQRLQGPR